MKERIYKSLRGRSFTYLLLVLALVVSTPTSAQKTTTFKAHLTYIKDNQLLPGSNKAVKFSPDAFLIAGYFHHNQFINRGKGLQGMAECHLNVADAADPQNYSLCEKLGLSVIVSKGPHLTGDEWLKFSDQEIDDYIRMMVKSAGKSKAIIGYYICDEPSALAFPALTKAVAAVKKYAPGKIAYINLYPNYATLWQMGQIRAQLGTKTYTEYLERFVNEVKPQIISYDNYMVEYSMDLKNKDKAASYYTNLTEVRRIATKYNIPFWNIVSSNQIRPFTTIPSPANLAFQAYTSLAAGAGGVIWYTYQGQYYGYNPLDKQENKTLVWSYLQEVNRQLSILGPIIKQLHSTGVYFTSPAPADSLPILPGKYVERIEAETPMMIGEFVSENGTNYMMAVNLSLEKSVKFKLTTKVANEKIWIVSAGESGYLVETDINEGYWLTAGAGVLIKCGGVATDRDWSVKPKPKY
jgi:hypothetical protein